jgi:3'-phosphoadenosine 5'-phosphosulfate synthase
MLLLAIGALAATELFAKDPAGGKKAAAALPALTINREGLEWVHVLSEGWATPLTGFMKENDYLTCLHYQHIVRDGKMIPMPVPIVLPISAEEKAKLTGTSVALKDDKGEIVAVLSNIETFEHRREERATRTFGISADRNHPYVDMIMAGGEWAVGGDIEVFQRVKYNDGMDQFRLTPNELQAKFKEIGADAVFVFQLRNPVHNGHALLMQDTAKRLKEQGFKKPVLWLSPLGGWTKDDDVPLDTRMAQHHAIIKNGVFGDTEVVLAIFPSPMLYAGPREVQWHAYARIQGGATHYIVGRDPAGMKHPTKNALQPALGDDLYHMWHGQTMLNLSPTISKQVKLLPFHFASYDTKAGAMAFFDPKRKEDFVSISGTKMRKMAAEGTEPPKGFMDPEGWQVLVKFYQSKKAEL